MIIHSCFHSYSSSSTASSTQPESTRKTVTRVRSTKGWCASPSDPCLTDLDRILTEGQDPGAQQYLVLGTVPIKGKNWGFGCPCIFCTRYRAHHVKTSPAGSCSIFPQSTWAPCPKRWDFLCIHVTGCARHGDVWRGKHKLSGRVDYYFSRQYIANEEISFRMMAGPFSDFVFSKKPDRCPRTRASPPKLGNPPYHTKQLSWPLDLPGPKTCKIVACSC